MTWARHHRLLLASLVLVLVVAVATLASRGRAPAASDAAGPSPSPTRLAPDASPSPDTGDAPGSVDLLSSVSLAAEARPSDLLTAGLDVAGGPGGAWLDLAAPRLQDAVERPVYVGHAVLSPDRRAIEGRVVVAFRPRDDEVVLRLLPAADALGRAGADLQLSVRQDGRAVPHEVDTDGARLLVDLDTRSGDAVSLDIAFSYPFVDRADIVDDGGPAAFGLLAWNPSVTAMGHWLPLLTLPGEDGPMVPWGDVGGFPPAVFSITFEHDGVLVTGGVESACPPDRAVAARSCTWARATTLRDLAVVVYDADPDVRAEEVAGVDVRAVAAASAALGNRSALESAVRSVRVLTERFGPLAWPQFEVAAVPLSTGAAGMEFPGLVFIDDEIYGSMDGGFGTYVVAHEAGHQWFHAMVGNGSLSSPVVDESLAQYASYLIYAEAYSADGAAQFRERSLERRYRNARASGMTDEPPGQPLAEFDGDGAYGPLVYARGALAWVDAEDELGRDTVVAFIRGLVEQFSLGTVTDDDVVALAESEVPALGATLRRYWLDPAPVR